MPTPSHNGRIKKSHLKKLIDNYYEVIKKKDVDGKIVDLDPKKDAKSVWFTKATIDKLFEDYGCTAENNGEYGLRIYFAVHKTGVFDPEHEIKPAYHNQQTVILVPTKKELGFEDHDLLKDDTLTTADGKGDPGDPTDPKDPGAQNHGKMCPPDTGCGCAF